MQENRKSFQGKISTWGESNHHFLLVPEAIATYFLDQGHKRVQLQLNEAAPVHCALRKNKEVGYLIGIGKRILKLTDTEPGQAVTVQLWPDDTTYQAKMPESLFAVLETDPEAHQQFHALTPGRQRSIIYWISKVKSIDLQIEKSLKVAKNLRAGQLDPRKW